MRGRWSSARGSLVGLVLAMVACASSLTAQSYVYGWGTNSPEGRLTTPADLGEVIEVDAGFNHSVALLVDGTVRAWGNNNGAEGITQVPTGLANVVDIDAGFAWTLVRRSNGTLMAWGANDSQQITQTPTGQSFVASSAGNMHGAALRSDGTVVCWGRNDYGQTTVPAGLSGVIAISASGHNTLALKADGTVVGWGVASRRPPAGLTSITKIASGDWFALGLRANGTVVAWGENLNGVTDVPVGLGDVVNIFAARGTAFALKSDGSLVAWGDNSKGLCSIPTLPFGQKWNSISQGWEHVYGVAKLAPPTISSQPNSVTVLRGQSATFSLIVSNTLEPSYQWHREGIPILGGTTATFTISSAQASDAGNYTCVVTNAAGSVTSSAATLTVNVPASVLVPPSSVSVNAGGSATFGVTATGTATITYQWQKNGETLVGATGSTLSLTDVRYLNEADYTCVVTNTYGSATSTAATLTVTVNPASPDTDGDGLSDSLETYLSVFGLDPAKNSTKEWARLLAMIPDLGAYYTSDQMRALAPGQPVLQRTAGGNFQLGMTLLESTNLSTWTERTLVPSNVSVNNGKILIEFPPLNNSTQFYRLQAQPTP